MPREIEEQLINLVAHDGSQEEFNKVALPVTLPGLPFHPTARQVAIVMPNGEVKSMFAGKRDWKDGKDGEDIDDKTTFRIGSTTKALTAGTFLSLVEDEKYKDWLPDGMETKLKDVLPKLQDAYPENEFIQRLPDIKKTVLKGGDTTIEPVGSFDDITMQDLVNHTHGMGNRNQQKTWDMTIEGGETKETGRLKRPEDILETVGTEYFADGMPYGNVVYSCVGPDMLAAIVTAAFRDVEKRPEATFSDVKREMLVDKIEGVELSDMPMHDKTFDVYEEGSNAARGYKEKTYKEEKNKLMDSHLSPHDPGAAGGQMANATGLAKTLQSIWTPNFDNSLYEEESTRNAMHSPMKPNGAFGYPFTEYGTARYTMDFGEGIKGKGHGGDDGAFFSNAILIEEGELKGAVAVVIVSGETLTPRMANDIMKKSKDPDFESFAKMGEGIEKILDTESGHSFTQMEDRVLKDMQPDEQASYQRAKEKFNGLIEHLNEKYSPEQLVEKTEEIIGKIALEKINERSCKNLDALDLATTAPISPELIEKAREIGADISLKPPIESERKGEEKSSWIDRAAKDNPRVGFNKTPGGAREI